MCASKLWTNPYKGKMRTLPAYFTAFYCKFTAFFTNFAA